MSIPDTKLDLPGDPWCGICGLCHPIGGADYFCVDYPDLDQTVDIPDLVDDAVEAQNRKE